PDPAVKQRALEIARRHSYLPVADAVTVAAPAARMQEGRSADDLRRAASNVLVRAFGTRAMGLEVQATPAGEVTVRGSVPTPEDRLAVSRELRRLPGCVCVVNLLRTPGAGQEPCAVTPASAPE